MRFLVRNIPLSEILVHLCIISLVLTSWGFLFYAGFVLPLPSYSYMVYLVYARMVAPDPIFSGQPNSPWCDSSSETGYLDAYEYHNWCQLNFANFTSLCGVFGIEMSDADRGVLYNSLDLSGDGLLSWGELSIDYFGTGDLAIQYYVKRWRQLSSLGPGMGLTRIADFDFDAFKSIELT